MKKTNKILIISISIMLVICLLTVGLVSCIFNVNPGDDNEKDIGNDSNGNTTPLSGVQDTFGYLDKSGLTDYTEAAALSLPSAAVVTVNKGKADEYSASGVIISNDGMMLTMDIYKYVSVIQTIEVNAANRSGARKAYNGILIEAAGAALSKSSGFCLIDIDDEAGFTPAAIRTGAQAFGADTVSFGYDLNLIRGAVSHPFYSDTAETGKYEGINELIKINADINEGDYGAGLFNMKGEFIGMVVSRKQGSAAPVKNSDIVQGIAYAIGSDALIENIRNNYGSATADKITLAAGAYNGSKAAVNKALESAVTVTVRVRKGSIAGYVYGSGTIISSDGLVLTNRHVAVPDGYTVTGIEVQLTSSDMKSTETFKATVEEFRGSYDLDFRLLRIQPSVGQRTEFTQAAIGASGNLKTGGQVFVLGNSANTGITYMRGAVSHLASLEFGSTEDYGFKKIVKINMNINHGNSGGALFDADGTIAGLVTYRKEGSNKYATHSDIVQGIGYAIRTEDILAIIKAHYSEDIYQKLTIDQGTASGQATVNSGKATNSAAVLIQTEVTRRGIKSTLYGSGTIISESGIILTNKHVIEESGYTVISINVTVLSKDMSEKQYSAVELPFSGALDLDMRLIQIYNSESGFNYSKISDNNSALKKGNSVFVFGNSAATGFTYMDGVIADPGAEAVEASESGTIAVNIDINHGNSGGGLFDRTGALIGLVTYRAEGTNSVTYDNIVQGLGYAIKTDDILRCIRNSYGDTIYSQLAIV